MTDVFNVSAAYDKPSYVTGDLITVRISGNAGRTDAFSGQVGPITIPIVAADGTKATVTVPMSSVTMTVTTQETVTIDTSLPIVDSSPTPRVWTVSADKLSISAVA